MPSPSSTHVALLRGVNVGGKNKLPMTTLTRLCEQLGCTGTRTYIQSGNVVFRAARAAAEALSTALSAALERELGLRVPVLVRSQRQLREVTRRNPFAGGDPGSWHVAFLRDRPPPARIADLDPERSPGDRFQVAGREVYLCCPNGMARTKLTNAYFDRALATVSTTRNWRTVEALLELVAEVSSASRPRRG